MKIFTILLILLMPVITFADDQTIDTRVVFTVDTKYGQYCDALYFPQNATPTQEEIDVMKKERVDNWINIIKNPPKIVTLTKEELQKEIIDIQSQIDQLITLKSQKEMELSSK